MADKFSIFTLCGLLKENNSTFFSVSADEPNQHLKEKKSKFISSVEMTHIEPRPILMWWKKLAQEKKENDLRYVALWK